MVTLGKLEDLFNNSIKLRFYLDEINTRTDRSELKKQTRELVESIRKISIASILQKKQTICITGLQGVGKSTFIKTMYDLPDGILNIGTGIGEKVPVIISEEKNLEKPETYKVVLQRNDSTKKYEEKHILIEETEFNETSANNDTMESPLYMELKLPEKVIKNQKTCFMLLPGFERNKDYWRELLTFSVSCSDSCIFAMTQDKITSSKNDEILNFVSEKIGFEKMVFVITHSESFDEDTKSEIRNTIREKINSKEFEDDRIVFTTSSDSEWLDGLKFSLEKYVNNNQSYYTKLNKEILDEIEKIEDIRFDITEIVENHISDNGVTSNENVNMYLKWYKDVCNKWRKDFDDKIKNSMGKAQSIAKGNLENELLNNRAAYYLNGIKRRFFGDGIEDLNRAQKLLDKSLLDDHNIPLYKIAFTEAVGGLLSESVTARNIVNFVPEIQKENRFLIENKKKEKKIPAELNSNEQEIKDKAVRICKDVSVLTGAYPVSKQTELVYRENGEQTMQLAVQSQVYEFSKQVLMAIKKNDSDGAKLLEITELNKVVLSMEDFENSLNVAQKGADSAVKAFNNMYGLMQAPKIEEDEEEKKNKLQNLSDTAKTTMGIAAVAAVDYIPDGSVNFLPGILEAMGLSAEAAAGIVVGIIAAVIAVAEIRTARSNLVEFQNEEKNYIDNVFETLRKSFLEQFDEIVIGKNTEILKSNLGQIFGVSENAVGYFNTLSVLHLIKDNLYELKKDLDNDTFANFIAE